MYECPNAVTFKVFSCAGPGNADPCDVEASIRGQPPQRGQSTRQQVMMLLHRGRGLFALHDKVQVNVEGRWVEGEIIGELGMEYQVQLSDNRTAWAKAQHLRRVAAPEKPAPPAAGGPPKPGLKSCAGKFEGRYASTAGGPSSFQITFRSGKATLRALGDAEEFECWMDREKIYLHKPGESADTDMPVDINNDGTLETPFGEIKKKGN
jgi:hypothetical protein